MFQLRGSTALSHFRQHKLITELRAYVPSLVHVDTCYIHFIDIESPLTPGHREILAKLLTYGPAAQEIDPDGQLILVTPRRGTISPWSSKATDGSPTRGCPTWRRASDRRCPTR